MAQTYGEAVRCEAMRDDVFAGQEVADDLRPARAVAGAADRVAAGRGQRRRRAIRGAARAAPSTRRRRRAATVDGRPFEWIADADSRLGPVLEAVINGRYYWVPFSRLIKIDFEPPEDLRDLVWMPAHLQFENGGESVALIPTRYPGSAASPDGLIALARKTVWEEIGAGCPPRARPAHLRHRRRATCRMLDVRSHHARRPPTRPSPAAGADHG